MVTTADCLPQYQQSIEGSMLPKTIQDAITTTRAMGLRYLWVDSLCILQDSEEDKSREIQRMGEIYQNSAVCILAAAAVKATDGFLRRIERPSRHQWKLPFFSPSGEQGNMILQHWTEDGEYDPDLDPVNQRAWIFQEMVLSPRLLIFPPAPHPIKWQCRGLQRSNGGSVVQYPTSHLPRLTSALMRGPREVDSVPTASKRDDEDLWNIWGNLLANFTSRGLSEITDNLPALSATATLFGPWGGTYLAGLWSNHLIRGLLWRYNPSQVADILTEVPSRGPSWSWASLHQRIIHVLTRERTAIHPHQFEVIDCQVTLSNPAVPFGRVRGGVLTVNALLKPALWTVSIRAPIHDVDSEIKVGQGIGDAGILLKVAAEYERPRRRVWCMAVLDASKYASYIATGLLLMETSNDCWQRVGIFTMGKHDWFDGCVTQHLKIV
jgi:hypothetical protein